MKVGFWNLNNNDNSIVNIVDFAKSQIIDLLVLFESSHEAAELLVALNSESVQYRFYNSIASDFFQIFTRFSTDYIRDVKDEGRISAKQYSSPLDIKVNFVFLHFPSKLYYNDDDQNAQANELKHFIDDLEEKTGCFNTLVLGDFNMNPFQNGMIQSTGLHSTFDKQIAMKGTRIIKQKEYKFFYNPMWSFFGEFGKGEVNGTYFNAIAKPICFFWNIFDQVLLRPELLENIFDESSLEIIQEIRGKSLLDINGHIDKKISDHLPIQFELNNI